MSERSEKAKELFLSGYNCSQAVLGVFCEEYGIDFNTAMKLSSPFGGGMGRMREVCGAVSGMFMAAGLIYGFADTEDKKAKGELYKKIQELANKFREKNGSIICRELLNGIESSASPMPSDRTETYYKKRPCPDLVADAVEIFEEFLSQTHPEKNINQV